MDEDNLNDGDLDGEPKVARGRLDKRERMKRWAASKPEYAVKGKRDVDDSRRAKGASRHVERDLDGARERDEQALATATLQKRCDEVEVIVRKVRAEVPASLIGHMTIAADIQALDKEIKASSGQPLEHRRALLKRLEQVCTEAEDIFELVSGEHAVLAWADAHPWRSTAAPLGNLLAAAAAALADNDKRAFEAACQQMVELRLVWMDIAEHWDALKQRYAAIGDLLSKWKVLALALPQTKPLVAALKLCEELQPLEQPLSHDIATSKEGLKPLDDVVTKAEALCTAFKAVPGLAELLASVTPPRFAKWPDLEQLLSAIASALGEADSVALSDAAERLTTLAQETKDAESDVAEMKLALQKVKELADQVSKQLQDLTEEGVDPERWEAVLLIGKLTEKLSGGLIPALVPGDTRTTLRADVDALKNWAAAIEAATHREQLIKHLGQAFGAKLKKVETGKARISLASAFGTVHDTSAAIQSAYEKLLDAPGPWQDELKKANAVEPISNWLQAKWKMEEVDSKPLAQLLANIDRKVTDLFDQASLTKDTFNALRARLGGSLIETIAAIRNYKREATLAHYAVFLQFKTVDSDNLASLVTARQVHFDTLGHQNPFRYFCSRCNMYEAEAKVNVSWLHNAGGPAVSWGVVHVHYHGLTHTTPNQQTYYHVKEHHFAPAGTEVVDATTINRVNAVIPSGVQMPN